MSETTAAATPIMRQYQALKAQNPDAILFFRLGDFYELFDEDARRAAPILELVLTQRQGIPMCGLPHHALPGYLGKLLKRGWRVAIAEQMEDPATTKGMVRRDVVRVVTPGTVLEEELLPAKQNNFLAAAWPGRGGSPWGLAWADMSTGELSFASLPDGGAVADELSRWDPRETLWPAGGPDPDGDRAVTRVEPSTFLPDSALRRAPALFGVKSFEGYGLSADHPALPAVAALLNYIERNQAPALGALRPPRAHAPTRFMALDALALRRLDLFPSDSGGDPQRPTSLWHLLDHTATAMGGRRLKGWTVNPLMDLEEIAARQDRVDYFLHHGRLRRAVVDLLRETADVERVLSRLTAGTASGRDLNALRRTLRQAPDLERTLRSGGDPLAGQHP
ncbi:MAG TPA: DNA mismatch repair protein MutS, partial [Elusimicrobiota bacterium]|nr:DNA mismatch repair protein MutS [Elusimicrobiota bacterium]